jgi:hypothetical protein
MFAYTWLTSFRDASRCAEVQEVQDVKEYATDVDVGLYKKQVGPFNSPGQLSEISTKCPGSPSEFDLELGEDNEDWDDLCSDCSSQEPESLKESFPCLSSFHERREERAKKSIKAWSAVGHILASSLAACEDDSEDEVVNASTQTKVSIEAWADVGQRFASALAHCEVDDEADSLASHRMAQKEIGNQINGWASVGDRLAGVLAKAAEEEDWME